MPDNYRDLFKDIYIFFQRNSNICDTEQDWLKAAKDLHLMLTTYPTKFCEELCTAVWNELERLAKHERG